MTTLAITCPYCTEDFADTAAFMAHHGSYAGGYCLSPRDAGLTLWVVGSRAAWRLPPGGARLRDDGQMHD